MGTVPLNFRRACSLVLAIALSLPLLAGFVGIASPAAAQDDLPDLPTPDRAAGVVDILQVSGLLDPILADFVIDRIEGSAPGQVRTIVLQVNSTGSVVDDDELERVAQAIVDSRVPITMWVGPSNAVATGAWVEIAALVERLGIASGAQFGDSGSPRLDASFDADLGPAASVLVNDTVSSERAIELGLNVVDAPSVGEFLIQLEDLGIETQVVDTDEGPRTQLSTTPRFQRLSLVAGQLHTVASPPVAYLMFTLGMALLVFEFYTAGVGVAGVVGAGMFLLGSYGLWVLPVRLFALALLVLAMIAFSVDVQTGVPRFWTIVGGVMLTVGTIVLFKDEASMSWIPMVVGIVGITFMMVTGMPTMVRTRFSTPTIGREWMVGQLGEVVESVDPDGVVSIDNALWKARTNRATPVESGGAVRVVAVEGLVLEVEPEEGGARDYRERRSD